MSQTPDQADTTALVDHARVSRIRLRAFLLAIPIIAADNYWVIMIERVKTGPYPTIISLFANVVFVLALLALLNGVVRRISPRNALSTAEMLVIYTMTAIGVSLAGLDFAPTLIQMLGYPYRFATPDNGWSTNLLPYLPKWLTVGDPNVLKPFYEGSSSLYMNGYWLAWLRPLTYWLAFVFVLFFVMMCINTIVRKQWSDRERLTFPIIQLPFAMTEPTGYIWRSRLFWMGFAISFGVDLINGLAFYYPNIPAINIGLVPEHNLLLSATAKPWNAIGWTPYTFYPFVIGLGYFLPLDLSFSCWFFFIFWKLQMVAASALALDAAPDFPYVRHQAFGGYVAILVMLTWTSRGYLKQVWLKLCERKSELDDSDEPMTYRMAAGGAVIGFLLLALFMKQVGMSPVVAIAAFLIYFILATAIARMRAELGPPVHDLHFSGPDYMITSTAGLSNLTKGDMVGLTYFFWFNRAYRGHPMPIGIEGMKMAQSASASQRKFCIAMLIAVVVGAIATWWGFLHLCYEYGLGAKVSHGSGFAQAAFRNLEGWMARPQGLERPNWGTAGAMSAGFVFCMLLGFLRLNVNYFPFHPIGYAISGSWSINLVWAPILIAWLIKIVMLKYGGLKLYKQAVPFFLGLILGEMIIGCAWTLIGLALGVPYYSFWGA
jgi:hypothetical protein